MDAIGPRRHNLTMPLESRLAGCTLFLIALALLSSAGGPSSPGLNTALSAELEAAGAAACAPEQTPVTEARNPGTPMPFLATEYAAMCEPELGRVPRVACDDGVLIPILVDGVEVFEDPGNHACDNPDGLRGGCSPGSRLGHVEGRDAAGNPLPQVSWVYFCRSVGPENLERHGWGSVQMIGYNRRSGATCFFEAADGRKSLPEDHPANSEIQDQRPWVSFDGHRMVGQMPGPDDPDFNDAFMPPPPADMNRDGEPDVVQCVQCHQSGPFIHDPFMDSARDPDDPGRPVMPEITGRDVPYYVVGGSGWDMRTIHIEGNRCLGCHSAPMEISQIFEAAQLEVNSFMPPHAPGSMADDYQELVDCWLAGPENTPGCDWVVPSAQGREGGVVGDDYPHKSDYFNQPGGKRSDEGKD